MTQSRSTGVLADRAKMANLKARLANAMGPMVRAQLIKEINDLRASRPGSTHLNDM